MKIITGNPGTGKHTIAKLISRKLNLEIIDINKIAISEGIFKKNNGTLDVDVDKLKKIIDRMNSERAILVGHLAPYVISPKYVEIAVVLRKSPYKLKSIYKKRKYTSKKSLENIGSEILGIIYHDTVHEFGRKKTFQIDTSDKSILTMVKKVESTFKGSKVEDNVDWLQLVLKKGDMQKFFPY
ncbi:adenylate kinase family protein [Candidatus Nitrosotalea bavarica]|uniref:adenylate kinase family protein n=1 Tax=Candidatus Nitrosotalea bavarica TaxID=1903277 RepID=UPI001FE67F60|nr:AAA family ATPase [Candidatus Nitrosotalea bavarica]